MEGNLSQHFVHRMCQNLGEQLQLHNANCGGEWLQAGLLENANQGLSKALEAEPENPVFVYNTQIFTELASGNTHVLDQVKPRMELFYNRMQ